MKYIIDKLSDPTKSEADKREFTRGVLGMDKFNAVSYASGWVAGWLLTPKRKNNDGK